MRNNRRWIFTFIELDKIDTIFFSFPFTFKLFPYDWKKTKLWRFKNSPWNGGKIYEHPASWKSMVTFDTMSLCPSTLQTWAPSYVTLASLTLTALWIVLEFSGAGSSTISIQSGITNSRFWRSITAPATATTKRKENATKRALCDRPVLSIANNCPWIDNSPCFYNIRAGRRSGVTGLNELASILLDRGGRFEDLWPHLWKKFVYISTEFINRYFYLLDEISWSVPKLRLRTLKKYKWILTIT